MTESGTAAAKAIPGGDDITGMKVWLLALCPERQQWIATASAADITAAVRLILDRDVAPGAEGSRDD